MKKYFIVAESGADLSQSIIERYNIHVLPMHVAVGGTDYLDGEISIEDLCAYYDKTGKVPMTAAVSPYQYQQVFEKIKAENPDAIIMHVCYSAQTSCTFQNAVIAAKDMNNIYHIDSFNVSVGQAFVVLMTAKLIEEHPDVEPEELILRIEACI